MSTDATPADVRIIVRHVDPPESAIKYALDKLVPVIHSIPLVRAASVEIIFEETANADERYAMQVTIGANGNSFRVEKRGPDVHSVTNTVRDTLDRQIRDWKGEVYYGPRQEGTAYKEEVMAERASLPPDNKDGLIVNRESAEMKPMFVEDAAIQLEGTGLDFLFFLNAESHEYNVVYHRKDGGYGWIVPSYTDMEPVELSQ